MAKPHSAFVFVILSFLAVKIDSNDFETHYLALFPSGADLETIWEQSLEFTALQEEGKNLDPVSTLRYKKGPFLVFLKNFSSTRSFKKVSQLFFAVVNHAFQNIWTQISLF